MTIKEVRERKHLTQQQVANAVGITSTAYARIERGEAKLTECKYSTVMKLISVLGDEILSGGTKTMKKNIMIVVVADLGKTYNISTGFDTIDEAKQFVKDSEDNFYEGLEIKYSFGEIDNFLDFSVCDVEKVVERINSSGTWDDKDLTELCEYAGLLEEWEKADGENFEKIVYEAAEILGFEI